ncbi:hypothetical protein ACWDUH_05180 [Micromonospora wenchangensis]
MIDVDGELDHQGMAIELIDAFAARDAAGLATLDAAGRVVQAQVRQALYDYVDRMWEDAKAHSLDPDSQPDRQVVAGLRDLTNALVERAGQAQADAGEG